MASSEKAIEWGAPHIYLSALPFAAKDSLVYKSFAPLCSGLVSVETFGIKRHNGGLFMPLERYEKGVSSIAYSLDGRLIGVATMEEIEIWDIRTCEKTFPPLEQCPEPINCITFSPNASIIAAGTAGGGICTWSLLERRASPQRWGGPGSHVMSLAFAPDGVRLASAMGNSVSLWQARTGDLVMKLKGHTGDVSQVAFSPDGATLASCSHDTTIRLWQIMTHQAVCKTLRGHEDWFCVICFSHDGLRLASGSRDGTVQLWDTQSRTVVATLNGYSPNILSIQFFTGQHSLIWITKHGGMHCWNLCPNGDTSSVELPRSDYGLGCASFSPNGLHVVAAHRVEFMKLPHVMMIWDVEDLQQVVQPLPAHKEGVNSVAVSSDGAFIASGSNDCSVRVWDADTGKPHLKPLTGPTEGVDIVTISPNGRLVAAAGRDSTLWIWNAQTGETIGDLLLVVERQFLLLNDTRQVLKMVFSSDSRRLLSISYDSYVRIWEATTGQLVKTYLLGGSKSVYQVALSPCGRIVAAGAGKVIYIWHADTGQKAFEPLQANIDQYSQIWFSPNGHRIAFRGSNYLINVWDINVRQPLYVLNEHDGDTESVAHSSNGRFICSASRYGSIHLSNASDGTFIAALNGRVGIVQSVTFTRDGQSIVTHSADKTIRVWDVKAACLKPERGYSDPVAMLASANFGMHNKREGWLVGPSGIRLLWVPKEYRPYLQISPCRLVIGKYRVVLRVEESGWHRGKNWTLCWKPNLLSPGLS